MYPTAKTMLPLNSQTHQRGRRLSSSLMPSASCSSSLGSLGLLLMGTSFRRRRSFAVVQRQAAHRVQKSLLLAERPDDRADEYREEKANRDDAVNSDAADVGENIFDHS